MSKATRRDTFAKVITDCGLSWAAKGVLAQASVLEEDEFTLDDLVQNTGSSVDDTRKILDELMVAGYIGTKQVFVMTGPDDSSVK